MPLCYVTCYYAVLTDFLNERVMRTLFIVSMFRRPIERYQLDLLNQAEAWIVPWYWLTIMREYTLGDARHCLFVLHESV